MAVPLGLSFLVGATTPAHGTSVEEEIRRHIERMRAEASLQVAGARISSVTVLPELYARRGFTPAWTDARMPGQLVDLIRTAPAHGLDPADYHLAALEELGARARDANATPALRAQFDLLLSDALLRVTYHSVFGKVDPESLDPHWNLSRELDPDEDDVPAEIQRIIDSGDIDAGLEALVPEHYYYRALREALARYRASAESGGWQPVPPGPTLSNGAQGARVVALRRRLVASGDLEPRRAEIDAFDADLAAAVARVQRRYRLEPDGVVGDATLEALNVPVEARIDQIRVNLERARWALHHLEGDLVLVDIAGFRVQYFRDDEPIWSSRVQVGRPYRRTPVFRDDISYVEVNPTWTVPPGILARDVLPRIQQDVGYLERNDMSVIAADGSRVDPHSIDWSAVSARSFPYRIVQGPGPRNALGRIKIMFPNRFFVFLHDTPSRALFERTDRAFSSGCIRVQKPFELAELLLDDRERWSREEILALVEQAQTRTVSLPRNVPVVLLYWTVDFDDDGELYFRRDLYGRDPAIVAALAQEFEFRRLPQP